jgi:hypothetical protein
MAGELVGYGATGVTHDFFAYNASNQVWNGSAFVAWVDANYATYRITATESGTSGRFTGNTPDAATTRYELRIRSGTLAGSGVVWEESIGDQAGVTTLLARLTAVRSGYLDNLNVGGAVASQADVLAINQSASRRIVLIVVPQFERPESGTTTYEIEARTYDPDGAVVAAADTPTLTATGVSSGSLTANLSGSPSNPELGVYRWNYTVESFATLEQVRLDVSVDLSDNVFTMSAYTQVCDFVASTWTTADRTLLIAVNNAVDTEIAAILEDTSTTLPALIAAGGGGLTAQQVRDAMKLTPTAGAPATGSVDLHLDDIEAKTGLLGTGSVVVVATPFVGRGNIEIYRGDDYYNADQRAVEFTDSGGRWRPTDITGATPWLRLYVSEGGSLALTVDGSVITPTGIKKVRFEPTATQTGLLSQPTYYFEMGLTLANTHVVTLETGRATIKGAA